MRAAAAVDDRNHPGVFEAGEASGVLFIATRYVHVGDARSPVTRFGPLPPAWVAEIVSQVASALDAAHTLGLVHRDVKLANMLLDGASGGFGRPDHVYLSDFGLSKASLQTSGLTGTGTFLGTLDGTSPEQIAGKPVDGRADEYSLACAAFELLCGAPPFQREEAMAVMYAQLSEPPPALTSRLPILRLPLIGSSLRRSPKPRRAVMQAAGSSATPCARRSGSGRTTQGPVPSRCRRVVRTLRSLFATPQTATGSL